LKEDDDAVADNFELDVSDGRFAAMFDKPEYNVDPSHPSFKKTKSMQKIVEEKQRRILAGDKKQDGKFKKTKSVDEPVVSLAKAIKAKTKVKPSPRSGKAKRK
jgi:hypothetical protein